MPFRCAARHRINMAPQLQPPKRPRRLWFPVLLASGLALLTIAAWQVLVNQQRDQLHEVISEHTKSVEALIKHDLNGRVLALNRLARRWVLVEDMPRDAWESDVVNLIVDQPGYQAIEWADPSLVIRWVVPLEGNEAAQNLDLTQGSKRRAAPEAARDRRETTFSRPVDLVQRGKGIVAYVPIIRDNEFAGLIVGVLRFETWLQTVLASIPESDYLITVAIADEEVYRGKARMPSEDDRWLQDEQFDLYGLQWRARVRPTARWLAMHDSLMVELVLITGLLLSLLIAYATYLAQTARHRARQLQKEIVAHRRVDEELRKSYELLEQRVARRTAELSAYLESAPDALLLIDEAGAVQLANMQSARLFGYTQDELHDMTIEALIPECYRVERVWQRSDFFANVKVPYSGIGREFCGLTKDGREVPMEITVSPIDTENGRIIYVAIRDVTERKRAADALHASTQQLRAEKEFSDNLIQTQQGIVLILDGEHRISLCNPYFQNLTGYQAAEVLGQDWFRLFIPEDERDTLLEFFHEIMRAGINEGYTNAIVTKYGERRLIHWQSKTMVDTDGNITGLLNTGYDVTDERAAAEMLKQAKEAAERANAAKSRFLATASHDLRQPLQSLNLLNRALRSTTTDPEAQKMLCMQDESLEGMSNLLNSLLDITRLESGVVVPEFGAVAMQPVFARMRSDFGPQAAAKGVELRVESTAHIAHTDPDLVAQIILNLVANAIRYTRNGSVTLRSVRHKDQLRIEVADTGIGIPPDQLHRIFDEFHQVNRDPQQHNEGLGLGLAIIQRIATLLDTKIEVESEQDQGSTFAFTLPLSAEAPQEPVSISVQSDKQPADGGTVPLLDDDPAVLESSQMLLKIEGFDVFAASTSSAAYDHLERLAAAPFIIVTDYHLGHAEKGIDVVRNIRERFDQEVPAVLVTGDTSPSMSDLGIKNVHLMNKPIKADELLSRIRNSLS